MKIWLNNGKCNDIPSLTDRRWVEIKVSDSILTDSFFDIKKTPFKLFDTENNLLNVSSYKNDTVVLSVGDSLKSSYILDELFYISNNNLYYKEKCNVPEEYKTLDWGDYFINEDDEIKNGTIVYRDYNLHIAFKGNDLSYRISDINFEDYLIDIDNNGMISNKRICEKEKVKSFIFYLMFSTLEEIDGHLETYRYGIYKAVRAFTNANEIMEGVKLYKDPELKFEIDYRSTSRGGQMSFPYTFSNLSIIENRIDRIGFFYNHGITRFDKEHRGDRGDLFTYNFPVHLSRNNDKCSIDYGLIMTKFRVPLTVNTHLPAIFGDIHSTKTFAFSYTDDYIIIPMINFTVDENSKVVEVNTC